MPHDHAGHAHDHKHDHDHDHIDEEENEEDEEEAMKNIVSTTGRIGSFIAANKGKFYHFIKEKIVNYHQM